MSYKESIGVRGDRIAPTIGDLARVRDFKGLKDLIHKPKTTMILDHAPHAVEILKLGGLNYAEFKNFVYTVEDLFFDLSSSRANKYASYTKDELNIDVQDEYCADIDRGKQYYFYIESPNILQNRWSISSKKMKSSPSHRLIGRR